MVRRIPPSAGVLQPLDDQRCLLDWGAHGLDPLVYWLLALDVDFEVLMPSALKDRLRAVGERAARCTRT